MGALASPYKHLFSLGTLVLIACNAILGNEEGSLTERDGHATDGTEPAQPTDDDAASGSVTATEADEAADAGAHDAAPPPNGCPRGTKACGGRCVSTNDPTYGCASPACTPCVLGHATATCAAGACGIAQCSNGWGDCNRLARDGCETDLTSASSCGGCGRRCALPKNGTTTCVAGLCIGACKPGFADCDGKDDNGCEAHLSKDNDNCGACRVACRPGHCTEGQCRWP